MDLYSARRGNFVIAVNWNKTRKLNFPEPEPESHLFSYSRECYVHHTQNIPSIYYIIERKYYNVNDVYGVLVYTNVYIPQNKKF